MNINATLVGQIMFVFVLVVGVLSYYLGRRKTEKPILAGLLGVFLCIMPPLALVYLMVLFFKKDVGVSTSAPVRG
ncbi:hypothetical protein ACO1PK_00250 [Alishewanella sp. d11]|uniref:hypothetical protein n=1 Tax=Alishewanella sp. d11 TaxID=3414030 RepID=UPI003BF7DC29